jgi:hypothetical protein
MNANHALALRERAARDREDTEHREQVAARLIVFTFKPPKTRRDAAQLQRDLDTWTAWTLAGTAPEDVYNAGRKRRTSAEIAAEKSTGAVKTTNPVKRHKAGPGIARDKEWAEKGEAKRRVACVVYELVPITGEVWCDGDTFHMAAPDSDEESLNYF